MASVALTSTAVPRRLAAPIALALVAAVVFVAGAITLTQSRDAGSPSAGATQVADLLALGLAAHKLGETDDAKTFYAEALEQDPMNVHAHYNLGLIAHEGGDVDAALVAYAAALQADPGHVPTLYNSAMAAAARDDRAAAIATFERLVAADETHAAGWYQLGTLYAAAGRDDEANSALNTALRLDPSLRPAD